LAIGYNSDLYAERLALPWDAVQSEFQRVILDPVGEAVGCKIIGKSE
jgi:hypothetical protein